MKTVTFELKDAPKGTVAVSSDCSNNAALKAIAVCCIRKVAASASARQGLDTTLDDISRLVYSSSFD